MSGNQIGAIFLFILAIPLIFFAIQSWKTRKKRNELIKKALEELEKYWRL